MTKTILETCDIWDTDYNSDNWESESMTIFATWQLRVTLDSIHNSCDVFKASLYIAFYNGIQYLLSYDIPNNDKSLTEISGKISTQKREWCENAKEGNSKEKSKGSSKLADQRLQREDEHLILLQDVGGDEVEDELVGGQLQRNVGAHQGEMLVGARNLANVRSCHF